MPGVAPGKAAYQSFNTRSDTVPAGTVTVRVTGAAGGVPTTMQIEASYGESSCAG